jgi:hypothetical protein
MKIYKILLSLVLIAGIPFFSACDPEDPSKEKQFLNKLSITWNMKSATLGWKDVTKSFHGLSLSINADQTYSATNPVPPIWTASGVFTLEEVPNSDLFNIIRDDGTIITVTELTETTLKYKFPYVAPGGRIKGISGEYEFVMIK